MTFEQWCKANEGLNLNYDGIVWLRKCWNDCESSQRERGAQIAETQFNPALDTPTERVLRRHIAAAIRKGDAA